MVAGDHARDPLVVTKGIAKKILPFLTRERPSQESLP